MKQQKTLLLAALISCFCSELSAQGNALVVRYGIGTSQHTALNWSDWAWEMTTELDNFGMGNDIQSYGSLSGELKIKASPRTKLVALAAQTPFVIHSNDGRSDVTMTTFAGGFQYMYVETGTTRVYTGALIGYTTVDITGNAVSPMSTGFVNGHCTLIGFEVGKVLFCSAELGYGIKGVLNGGIGLRF